MRMMAPGEEELIATADPTNTGMRVCRRVKCCLEESTAAVYELKAAGTAPSVQWMMTAAADSCFLVTVSGRGADSALTVLAHLPVGREAFQNYKLLLLQHTQHGSDVDVRHLTSDTPTKRLRTLMTAAGEPDTPPPFNKRRALAQI